MDSKDTLFRKGQIAFMEGKPEESVKYFTSAIDTGYDTDVSLLSRGVAYFKLKDYDSAIEDFTCLMDSDKKRDRAYYYRGISNLAKEDLGHAVSDFNKAIELNRENGPAFVGRALSLSQLGRHEEADKDFKSAILHSDAHFQGFADANNILRTQFNRAMAIYEGDARPYSISLTDEEIETLKKWFTECGSN